MEAASLELDRRLAMDAARAAAEEVMRHYGAGGAVRLKAPDQPVTDADLGADAALQALLLGRRPDYGWLSEESVRRTARTPRTWVVDPIDGTSSFVRGIPEFGVSVALLDDGVPVLGVILNPVTGDLYHATAGGGAFRGDARIRAAGGSRRRLVVSPDEQARGDFAALAGWEQVPCGSTTIKMCRVAEGSADAYVSAGPKHAWDVCAADLIVREAGGRVTDGRGAPLEYDRLEAAWSGLVACRPALHPELVRL